MSAQGSICVSPPATQAPAKMGHNNPPKAVKTEPFGLRAAWLHFANQLELRRLSKLHGRIERRQQSLNELVGERQLIMNRCIRRMRRSSGKN